jgi:hypothetical protein
MPTLSLAGITAFSHQRPEAAGANTALRLGVTPSAENSLPCSAQGILRCGSQVKDMRA